MVRIGILALGIASAAAAPALAFATAVPEIDGVSGLTALTLVAALATFVWERGRR